MRTPRRALLGSIATLSLSGCLGRQQQQMPSTTRADRDQDGVPDHADDYPTDDRRAFQSSYSSGSPTLQPGEFSAVALTNSPQASDDIVHYEVSTASDTSIDCLVFERSAYDAYESGNRDVSVVSRYSRTDVTSVSVTEQLGRGEYIFVVDYTELLTSPETDSVEVRYTVDIAEPVTSRTTR
jgi:hypothetical protein